MYFGCCMLPWFIYIGMNSKLSNSRSSSTKIYKLGLFLKYHNCLLKLTMTSDWYAIVFSISCALSFFADVKSIEFCKSLTPRRLSNISNLQHSISISINPLATPKINTKKAVNVWLRSKGIPLRSGQTCGLAPYLFFIAFQDPFSLNSCK